MLLDIQGDMNAIKNTMNELEKLSDKEKAEEYAIKITDELKNKGCISYEEINQRYAGIIQGYEYGYKAGKKHEADKIFDEWCSGTHDYPQKCEFLKKLEKENAELKAQNEKMKNFYNCAHSNRALCPNEHNCKGCKDWELAE